MTITRRRFIAVSAMAGAALAAACSDDGDGEATPDASSTEASASPAAGATAAGTAQTLAPTPACGDDDDVTVEQTEGPFFTPDSPERTSLREPGIGGPPLVVVGRVLSTDCLPVAGALLDFWQCDDDGMYDTEGYRLRGHQFAGDDGAWRLETIVPGLYPGRTRHIHVKVQAPGRPVLTTQLYFPGEPDNQTDAIFDDALVMTVDTTPDGDQAAFDFVLDIS